MAKKLKITYKPLALVLVVAFCLFLLPAPANAQGFINCALNGIIDCTLYYVKSLLVNFIALLGSGIDTAMRIPIAGAPVVASSWEIVRGFANMFFIIALIIMAFGTIFSIQQYDFRKLILNFLIAALLINFSLVIGEIIIDWSTSLSNVFLDAIGSVGDRLAQGADLGKHFDPQNVAKSYSITVDLQSWDQTLAAGLDIVMLSIIFFSLAVLLFFSIVRVPILWALLIVSPIAWITYILPTTMSINKKWWNEFIAWNVFMPVYLFFIYFGVLFLGNKQQVLANNAALSGFSGTAFQDIFFYILIGVFLIGGAKFAISSSRSAGTRAVAAGIWAKGRATAKFGRSLPGRAVGLGWRATGAADVYKEARKTFKEQGFAGFEATEKNLGKYYQGQQGRDKAAARLGEITGLAPGLVDKQLGRNIDFEKTRLKDRRVDVNELKTIISTSTNPAEVIAATQRLQDEFGAAPDASQVTKVIRALGRNVNTEIGARTLKQIKWGEMDTDDLRTFLNSEIDDPTNPGTRIANPNYISDANTRSAIYNSLIERNKATKEEIVSAISLAKGTAQKAGIARKAKEWLEDYSTPKDRRWLLEQLKDNSNIGANNETRASILMAVSKKGDDFFYDKDSETADLNLLHTYTDMIENPAERKAFLDNIAKKHASSATTEMLNRGMLKDDAGNDITNHRAGLERVLSKLNKEDQLGQNLSQYNEPDMQEALGARWSRSVSTLQGILSDDKYSSIASHINRAQELSRQSVYINHYYGAFKSKLDKATALLNMISKKSYATAKDFDLDIGQIRTGLTDLKRVRDNYEQMCRDANILDAKVQAQLSRLDSIMQVIRTRVGDITNKLRPKK